MKLSAKDKKQILLEMVKNGDPKPKPNTVLCNAFRNYTIGAAYDEKFVLQISELGKTYNNDWMTLPWVRKKQQILEMIKNGDPKPKKGDPLLKSYKGYAEPSSSSYDRKFARDVKDLNQKHGNNWFEVVDRISPVQKKHKMLEMIKNGEPKPCSKNPLNKSFRSYVNPSNNTYDAEFVKDTKEYCQKYNNNWFVYRKRAK